MAAILSTITSFVAVVIELSLILLLLLEARLTQQCPSSSSTAGKATSSIVTYNSVSASKSPNGSCGHSQYWNAGEPTSSYIVGGSEALNHEFPWQVYLYIRTGATYAYACGGSVIAWNFVMTAAHCCALASDANNIYVYYGTNNLNGTSDNTLFRVPAIKLIMHPSYSTSTLDYDFCIIKVADTPLLKNAGWAVQPICLPTSCSVTCQAGEYAMISGWGLTTEGGSTSTKLLKAMTPVVSTASCASSYSGSESITDIKVCAGYTAGGIAPCSGDSGGPLACFKNGYFTLDGVVSNAVGCARASYPAVFSRVCSVSTWINSTMTSS